MLRYKTETRPGLVALYDIRPGNAAGQFLQPQSPHGANHLQNQCILPKPGFWVLQMQNWGFRFGFIQSQLKFKENLDIQPTRVL